MTDIPGTLVRCKVTWVHPYDGRGKAKITHPTVWVWTDADGIERVYATKGAALADIAERS